MKIKGLLLLSTILSSGYLGASDEADVVPANVAADGDGTATVEALQSEKARLEADLDGLRKSTAQETDKGNALKASLIQNQWRFTILKKQQKKQAEAFVKVLQGEAASLGSLRPSACPSFQKIIDRNFLARSTPAIKGEDSIRLMQNPTRAENLFMHIGLKFGAFKINTLPSVSFLQTGMAQILKDLASLAKELGDLQKQVSKKGAVLNIGKTSTALSALNKILADAEDLSRQQEQIMQILSGGSITKVEGVAAVKTGFGPLVDILSLKSVVSAPPSDGLLLTSQKPEDPKTAFLSEIKAKITAIKRFIQTQEKALYAEKKVGKGASKTIKPAPNGLAHAYTLLKQGHIVFKGKLEGGKLKIAVFEPLPKVTAEEVAEATQGVGVAVASLLLAGSKTAATVTGTVAALQTLNFKTIDVLKSEILQKIPSITSSGDEDGDRAQPVSMKKSIVLSTLKARLRDIKLYKALDQLDDLSVEDFDSSERLYVLIKPDVELYSKKLDLDEFISAVMFKKKSPKKGATDDSALYSLAENLDTGKKRKWYKGLKSTLENAFNSLCKMRDSRICSEKADSLLVSINRCKHASLPRCFKAGKENPLVTKILENIYDVLTKPRTPSAEAAWDTQSLASNNKRTSLSKKDFIENNQYRENVLAYIRLTELTNREMSWDGRIVSSKMMRRYLEMMMQDVALKINEASDLQGNPKIKVQARDALSALLKLNEEERDALQTESNELTRKQQEEATSEQRLAQGLSLFLEKQRAHLKQSRRSFLEE